MAEYYPLISRAVANLGESTPDQRKALYASAPRNALLGQLRVVRSADRGGRIDRERLSLEDAISRVETEMAGGVDRDLSGAWSRPLRRRRRRCPSPRHPCVRDVRASSRTHRASQEQLGRGSADSTMARTITKGRRRRKLSARPGCIGHRDRASASARTAHRDARPALGARARSSASPSRVVVGLTAVAAIMLKHQPSDFAPGCSRRQAARATASARSRSACRANAAAIAAPGACAVPSAPAQTPQALRTTVPNPAPARADCLAHACARRSGRRARAARRAGGGAGRGQPGSQADGRARHVASGQRHRRSRRAARRRRSRRGRYPGSRPEGGHADPPQPRRGAAGFPHPGD